MNWKKKKTEETRNLCSRVNGYRDRINKLKIRDWVVDQKYMTWGSLITKSIILIPGLPFFIYGGLLNSIPFLLIDRIVRKKVKDITFRSTFFSPSGLVLFPVFYLLELILLSGFLPGILVKIAFLISIPVTVTGKIAFRWVILFRKISGQTRLFILKHIHKHRYSHLFRTKQQILKDP